MSNCPVCGKDTKAPGHILTDCLSQNVNKGRQIQSPPSQNVNKVSLHDFKKMKRAEIVNNLPFVLIADGETIAEVRCL